MKVRKPGQLTDDEKGVLKQQLLAGCRNIGAMSVYNAPGQRAVMYDRSSFGLCADCGHFKFTATQYRVLIAMCDETDGIRIPLSEDDPVTDCSSYYKRGEQDAHDYSKNAWLLDMDETKEVGF
jgi:hypothetical protein